jgi:hypothetical protein
MELNAFILAPTFKAARLGRKQVNTNGIHQLNQG